MAQEGSKRSPVERPIEAAAEAPKETQEGPLDRDLYRAASFGVDHEKVKRLLDEGANPNWPYLSDHNKTALHNAALYNYPKIVKTLLVKGADVKKRATNGKTPLHYSTSQAVVEALVGSGADVAATDQYGNTPLHMACYWVSAMAGTVPALVAAGANVHAKNNKGDTPLHKAAQRANVRQIEELVTAGADLDCTNNAGQTPRDVATPEAKLALDRARLASQFEVQVPPDRVMLMFCGNGMVGKTTLTKALQHGKVDPAHPVDGRTYGFDSFGAVIPHASECTMVDFGGQPEFWVPHGVFLGNRSGVYLVVVNLGDTPSTQRLQLRHWLRFIVSRSKGGTRPQVAVVGSHRGAAASIDKVLKEEAHTLTPDEQAVLRARLRQLNAVAVVGDRRVSPTLQSITRSFHNDFAEVLNIAPNPFLVESVNPDAMDAADLTRLQHWLGTAFTHIRETRKVPRVCIQVAALVTSHLRSALPPITTYDAVMAALKDAAGDSIDFSDDARNRAILSHLWEAGHLMVFEGVGDTVVVDPQAFGVNVIGQIFCPHGDPDFESLVVNEDNGFVFRQSQLETHLARVREQGCDFGDAQLALQLLSELELIVPLTTAADSTDDPLFAIPGRLNQVDVDEYRQRPPQCWAEPRKLDGWVYLGVRLKLVSPLSLIPPSEFPRLQHRLSSEPGFRMWRHGLCMQQYTPRGLIEVEGLVELNHTLEHIDVCVRSQVGGEKACGAKLMQLVQSCCAVSNDFECAMLVPDSLMSHDDTERHVVHCAGSRERSNPVEWLRVTLQASARESGKPSRWNLFTWVGSMFRGGGAASFDAAVGAPTHSLSPSEAPFVTVVVSCPETASLSGSAPYDINVFEHCERLREAGRILLAFDRPRQPEVGLREQHPDDVDLIWSMADPRLDGQSPQDKWQAVQESVKGSFWFYGFRDRIKGALLGIAQSHIGKSLRLICIKGGPITNLEQQEMNTIANEVERQLDEISVRACLTLQFVSYANFTHDFP